MTGVRPGTGGTARVGNRYFVALSVVVRALQKACRLGPTARYGC